MTNSHNVVIISGRSDSLFLTNVTDQAMYKMDTGGEIISNFARTVIVFVNHMIFDMCICVCGIAGNCLSITVFLKQGLRTSVNLSLFAMSVSDLIGLTFQVWHNFCLNPYLEQSGLPVDFLDVQVLTAGCPNVAMTRITSWITMYITAERCLSVLTPFKVGRIITYERSAVILLFCYGINLTFFLPRYASEYLSLNFDPELNISRLGRAVRENETVIVFLINISHVHLSILAFVVVIVNTAILVVSLKRKSEWRKNATRSQNETLSNREKKTVMLVISVATVLIVCYAPGVTCAFLEILVPDFTFYGKQENVYHVIWSFCFLFNSINASINVFVYYKMSSKYRNTFQEICPRLTGKTK
ncbi:thyrotropin-releasing hormone receptor [Biomphalaria glabrata]|nr:thyrotropin-releasing hormone receptor-like [Biomphalaria glabrata]